MTNRSENLDQLATALSSFQGEVEDIKKTNEVKGKDGKVKFKHAELSGVLEIVRPLLKKNGLSVTQLPTQGTKISKESSLMTVGLETMLLHTSGQWVSSMIEMTVSTDDLYMNDPQKVGTIITYARRYGIAAILGITQVDDEQQIMIQKERPTQKNNPGYPKATQDQVNKIRELLVGDPMRIQKILIWKGVECLEDLPVNAATEAINRLLAEKTPENKEIKLISEQQMEMLKKLVTPDRLIQMLDDYNLTKLEDMKLIDYHYEYDNLRLETTVEQKKQQVL